MLYTTVAYICGVYMLYITVGYICRIITPGSDAGAADRGSRLAFVLGAVVMQAIVEQHRVHLPRASAFSIFENIYFSKKIVLLFSEMSVRARRVI